MELLEMYLSLRGQCYMFLHVTLTFRGMHKANKELE